MQNKELIIVKGYGKGKRIPLNKPKITIGRSTDNKVVLEDEKVSRYHCVVSKTHGGKYEIQDLESTNLTLVNNEPIKSKIIDNGDLVKIGDSTLLLTTAENAEKLVSENPVHIGTKVITVTEMKIVPDENKILDVSSLGDNLAGLRRAHHDLATIYKIGSIMNKVQDTGALMDVLTNKLMEVVQAGRVVLILFGTDIKKIVSKKVRTRSGRNDDISNISMSMVEEAASEKMAILSYDALADDRFKDKHSVILNKIRSVMCIPIMVLGKVLGVIYIDTMGDIGSFSEYDLQFLSIIANQAGIAIQNAKLYEDLDDLFTGTLKTLVAAIEAKDSITSGHSIRVTSFSTAIGEELGLEKDQMRILEISSLLHDIGKVGVPEAILGKAAPLSEDEFVRLREHAPRGAEIVKNIKNVEGVVAAIRHHHERYDGKGIPGGLKGESIPLISRIIAVADTFDAMSSDRPYRKKVSFYITEKEILSNSGTQFDPKIVEAFKAASKKGRLHVLSESPWMIRGKKNE